MIQNRIYSENSIWLDSFNAIGGDIGQLLKVEKKPLKSSSGREFVLYYNPGRESRPNSQGENNPTDYSTSFINGMEKERRRIEFGDQKNLLDTKKYNGYWVIPNLYPICIGHVVLIQGNSHKNKTTRSDLEGMLDFSLERDYGVWHNTYKAASTFHEEDHFQAIPGNFPIDFLELEQIEEERYKIKKYIREHAVFTGYNCTQVSEKMIKNLDAKNIPHIILCSKGFDERERVYVFPVKVPQYKGGKGGFEAGGNIVTKNKREYNRLNNADKFESELFGIFYEELPEIYEEEKSLVGV